MNTIASKASFLLVLLLFLQSVFAQDPISSCDGISNGTRSQICLSGQCPLRCYTNSSNDPNCDQVCVVQPCAALSCNSTNCLQRCLSGGCNSLVCTGADCTQTCLGNCSEINCTVTAKCNQQCEKGHCGLRGMGYGVVEQRTAKMWNVRLTGADKPVQETGAVWSVLWVSEVIFMVLGISRDRF